MRISEQWLNEWVDVNISTQDLAHKLTMAGLEVDSIESLTPEWTGIFVAEIKECEQHPDADKLRVCKVDGGDEELLQIVCGAPNARPGIKVPLAKVGAEISPEFKIKKAKLRGVESFGMLCSAKELGLTESSEGLLEFPDDAPVGTPVEAYLNLNDTIIEVDLTPNRGDCLGMRGIAREASVLTRQPLKSNNTPSVQAGCDSVFPVEIKAPEDCPRYVGRVINGVDPLAPTPLWMQERLRRCGLRSISFMVDVTNYILLELGQPMHAFDLNKLEGGIVVRKAAEGEKLELLDGKEITLDQESLLIADHKKPLALAGIMGGDQTSVTDDTTDLFLESAFFTPHLIAGRARRFGLHTDSSHRFERGVDPFLQTQAIERATELIIEVAGGTPGPIIEACHEAQLPQKQPVLLRRDRIKRLLGIELADNDIVEILELLEMGVEPTKSGWNITVPLFRFDVNIEADLIEELGRIYGYDNLPTTRFSGDDTIGRIPETETSVTKIRQVLVDHGFNEAITYSFVDRETQKKITPDADLLELANPISEEMTVMRTSLWPGLMAAASHNLKRQQERIRLFETGLVFAQENGEIIQTPHIGGIMCGPRQKESWNSSNDKTDFYDAKGVVETLLSITFEAENIEFTTASNPALHPGQSAKISVNNAEIGWIGTIHPKLAQELNLPQKLYIFELDLKLIKIGALPNFQQLSKFPSVRRDLAFVIEESISAATMISAVRKTAPDIIRDVNIFDLYRGENIEKDCKSIAISLILQDFSRTLIDEEVDSVINKVVDQLSHEFNAKLRT